MLVMRPLRSTSLSMAGLVLAHLRGRQFLANGSIGATWNDAVVLRGLDGTATAGDLERETSCCSAAGGTTRQPHRAGDLPGSGASVRETLTAVSGRV
jgi:hypothetical protein